MKVNLLTLVNGVATSFENRYDAETLELNTQDLELIEPLDLKGELERIDEILSVKGVVVSKSREMCGRCLAKMEHSFQRDVSLAIEVEKDQRICDFTPELREEILLSYPAKILCKENCKGLCDNCGANLNVTTCDCHRSEEPKSPFEILKKLKKDKK